MSLSFKNFYYNEMSIKVKMFDIKTPEALAKLNNSESAWLNVSKLSLEFNPNIDLRKQNLLKENQEI